MLNNVKTRGIYGEVQLAALLEQVLTPGQYATHVATVPGSTNRVEYAVRLPGGDAGTVYMPVDAKFPQEDYQRLLEAQETADATAAEAAARALEIRIKAEAKDIRDKYLSPPHTTDFGILFLPVEGLYAEVLKEAHNRFISLDLLTEVANSPLDARGKLGRIIDGMLAGLHSEGWHLRVFMREIVAPTATSVIVTFVVNIMMSEPIKRVAALVSWPTLMFSVCAMVSMSFVIRERTSP